MLFRFAQPEFLWLLPLAIAAGWLAGKPGRRGAILFPATAIAADVARAARARPGRFRDWLRVAALIAGVLALARPQFGSERQAQHVEGIDIMLTVDLSTSMWAHDFEVDGRRTDRLTAVTGVMENFIQARPNDRIGLVAFAGFPYLVSPLTVNHSWLLRRLHDLEIGMIEDGTAIGSAIGSATNRLESDPEVTAKNSSNGARIVVLLTDGANNRGKIAPMQAAEAAAALGIRVYTVGVGQEQPAPFPHLDRRTGRPLLDRSGRMIFTHAPSDLDLEVLQEIADRTGGRFFHARNTDELEKVYAEIDQLEKTELEIEASILYRDWFTIPLGLCVGFHLIDWILRFTRFRRLPS